jgi:hypothetical protein
MQEQLCIVPWRLCPKGGYDRYKRKKMLEMIIMLMTRRSPARSEERRRRLTEGLL